MATRNTCTTSTSAAYVMPRTMVIVCRTDEIIETA